MCVAHDERQVNDVSDKALLPHQDRLLFVVLNSVLFLDLLLIIQINGGRPLGRDVAAVERALVLALIQLLDALDAKSVAAWQFTRLDHDEHTY